MSLCAFSDFAWSKLLLYQRVSLQIKSTLSAVILEISHSFLIISTKTDNVKLSICIELCSMKEYIEHVLKGKARLKMDFDCSNLLSVIFNGQMDFLTAN